MIEESEGGVTGAGAQGAAAIGISMNEAARDTSAAAEAREYLREQTESRVSRRAPNWGSLHLKWGEALYNAGRKDEAKRQFEIASHLDLSKADGAALARMRPPHG